MFKAVVKTIALLAILFVMLYVGVNNTHEIDFNFPIVSAAPKPTPIHASAALIFFGLFAIGLLAGTILTVGNHDKAKGGTSSGGGKKSSSKDR